MSSVGTTSNSSVFVNVDNQTEDRCDLISSPWLRPGFILLYPDICCVYTHTHTHARAYLRHHRLCLNGSWRMSWCQQQGDSFGVSKIIPHTNTSQLRDVWQGRETNKQKKDTPGTTMGDLLKYFRLLLWPLLCIICENNPEFPRLERALRLNPVCHVWDHKLRRMFSNFRDTGIIWALFTANLFKSLI